MFLEILRFLPHILREIRANTVSLVVDDPKLPKLTYGCMNALGCTLKKRLGLRMLQRWSENFRHFSFDRIANWVGVVHSGADATAACSAQRIRVSI